MPKPCIIITRPLADSENTAKILSKHGLDHFIEPALVTEFISSSISNLSHTISKHDGIIITSKNAIRSIASINIDRNIKIISLGKATSSFAKKIGFTNVEYAGQNIGQLCQHIKANYKGKSFTYASGESITVELNKENCGNEITRISVYKTVPTQKLSQGFKEKLQHGNFNGIMFFSKRTAEIFYNILKAEGLELHIQNLHAFCLSNDIAELIKNYGFKATMYPKNPNIGEITKLMVRFRF